MTQDIQPGTQLGRFLLGAELGRGGMGVVFAATDPRSEAEVVVKVLLPGLGDLEAARMRFIREAETYRKLTGSGVAPYVASGIEGSAYYLVLGRVRGPTLGELLDQHPSGLGIPKALRLIERVAEILGRAHDLGVIHRDLKPENLILAGGSEPTVIDFGLAAGDDALLRTKTGAQFGTFRYSSPEQNQGRRVDLRSDLYSLGVLGYEALTGKLPFAGKDRFQVMLKQLNHDYRPPSEMIEGVDPEIDALFWRLFRVDLEKRFTSASAVLDALKRFFRRHEIAKNPWLG